MPRPVAEVVAILRDVLEAAERGAVTDVFVVYREAAGEYGSAFWTFDVDDLLFQVNTESMYVASQSERADESRH